MKTHNWQTKALTLFIAAAIALWLITACVKEYPIEYPFEGLRITSSDSCDNEESLKPSREFIQLAEQQDPLQMSYPTDAHLRSLPGYDEARDSRWKRIGPELERINSVLDMHRKQLERNPYYGGSFPVSQYLWDNIPTDRWIIEVHLDHLVDPRTVPPEDRIPGCIAGIPVHIIVGNTVHFTQD